MADDPKFSVTFSAPQLDFVGKLVVDTLNAAQSQAKMASEVYALLRGSVTAVQAPSNGVPAQAAARAVVDAPVGPAP